MAQAGSSPRSGSGARREARAALEQRALCDHGSAGTSRRANRGCGRECGFGGSVAGPGADEQGGLAVSPGLVEGGRGKGPFLQAALSHSPRVGEGMPFTSRMFAQELRAQGEPACH